MLDDEEKELSWNEYLDHYIGPRPENFQSLILRCILFTYKRLNQWLLTAGATNECIEASVEIPIRALILQYIHLNRTDSLPSHRRLSVDAKGEDSLPSISQLSVDAKEKDESPSHRRLSADAKEIHLPSCPSNAQSLPSSKDSKTNRICIPSSIWSTFMFIYTYMRVRWMAQILSSLNSDSPEFKDLMSTFPVSITNVYDGPTFYNCYIQVQNERSRINSSSDPYRELMEWISKNYKK
jgi:hypothetical protein